VTNSASTSAGEVSRRTGSDPWQILARSISGPMLRPGDPGFDLPFNLRECHARRHRALPHGARRIEGDQVGAQVSLPARRAVGRPFRRRLLGHHRPDDRHQAHGFSHIRQQDSGVYEALEENNVTITHGRCPQVGVAGFLLGGGIGFNIRRLGVGIDALVASEIVTASGDILPLSQRRNPGVFWACRGGAAATSGLTPPSACGPFRYPLPSRPRA
jgi:hypothetical protein